MIFHASYHMVTYHMVTYQNTVFHITIQYLLSLTLTGYIQDGGMDTHAKAQDLRFTGGPNIQYWAKNSGRSINEDDRVS